MRTARPLPLSRMIRATLCSADAASGLIVALSKSNSTSAASSMRISVAVSFTSRFCAAPATFVALPPRSSTTKLRSLIRAQRYCTEKIRSDCRPVVSGCCATAGNAPKAATSASTNAKAWARIAGPLLADRHVIHWNEVRHHDTDLLNPVRRRREFRPQIEARLRLHGGDVVTANAALVGIADNLIFLLAGEIEEIDAVDSVSPFCRLEQVVGDILVGIVDGDEPQHDGTAGHA